jgi:uncharacterized membrane protein YbjE (DUF340 family)
MTKFKKFLEVLKQCLIKLREILVNVLIYGLGIELIEELLEELFAWVATEMFTWVVTKAFSAATIFVFSQTAKYAIKKIIKSLTYKEGNDKMATVKKYLKLAIGNKVTGTLAGVGIAGIVYFQDFVAFATGCWWIALIAFIIGYNIGIFFGGEDLNQIIARAENAALVKQEKQRIKAIKNKVKELDEKRQEALYAQASEIVEAEKAKAEAEAKKTN